jgi:putative ABC transport system permease protein
VILRNVGEGVAIALDAIRSNKLRSALTILGVVIGVTTVMAVASLVQGIRRQIFNAIEVAGPTTFYVIRYFSQTPVNPDRLPYEVRIRPVLQRSDADAIRRLEEIRYAGIWVQVFQKAEYQSIRTQQVVIFGADSRYMDIQGGTLLRGRFFSQAELKGEPVIVLESAVADRLFGRLDPLGAQIRIGGISFRVIGVFEKPSNIFEPPGQATGGVVPFATARESFR